MGQLFSRAGPRARLQVSSLEDRCTPSATIGDPRLVASVSINGGAETWESVNSIRIEFTREMFIDPSRAVHLMESHFGGLVWTEVEDLRMEMGVNTFGHSELEIGPSAGDAIVVDGDYKIVLTQRFGLPVELTSFHGIDLGDLGDGDQHPWG